MKPVLQKHPFCGDFSIIKNLRLTSISYFSKLSVVYLLVFSSTLLLNFNALSVEVNSQQVPVKKVVLVTAKSATSKIVKGKANGKKSKKSVVIKKDTLNDVDPASASSPLYNN